MLPPAVCGLLIFPRVTAWRNGGSVALSVIVLGTSSLARITLVHYWSYNTLQIHKQ